MHVIRYFVVFRCRVGRGGYICGSRESFVACEFGIETDQGIMVSEDFEGFLEGCGGR